MALPLGVGHEPSVAASASCGVKGRGCCFLLCCRLLLLIRVRINFSRTLGFYKHLIHPIVILIIIDSNSNGNDFYVN